jgi:hypothetical protein
MREAERGAIGIVAMNNWLTLVLTSAAVGALASSVVTFVGQVLERRARRDELLLTKALEIAVHRTEMGVKIAEQTGVGLSVLDEVISAETYYRWLKSLLDTGKLPPDADQGRRQ